MEAVARIDLGLDDAQEARASRLHDEALIVDMMFQGPCDHRAFDPGMVATLQQDWERTHDPIRAISRAMAVPIRRALAGQLAAYESVWRQSGITAANLQVHARTVADVVIWAGLRQREVETFPWLIKALTARDMRRAKIEGRHAGFFNLQFVPVDVGDQLELLDGFWDLGVRMIGLTYNTFNGLGSGCTEHTDSGVTALGAAVIKRLNELRVIVDVAHAGRRTTVDACRLSTRPVVASHTSADGIYPYVRSKTDAEMRAIADTGGVIGVLAVPFHLSNADDAGLEVLIDHIEHVAEVAGIDHVALGTDWPMQLPSWTLEVAFRPFATELGARPGQIPDRIGYLAGFDSYLDYPNVTRALVKRGLTDDEIRKILGKNAIRVFRDVCG